MSSCYQQKHNMLVMASVANRCFCWYQLNLRHKLFTNVLYLLVILSFSCLFNLVQQEDLLVLLYTVKKEFPSSWILLVILFLPTPHDLKHLLPIIHPFKWELFFLTNTSTQNQTYRYNIYPQ